MDQRDDHDIYDGDEIASLLRGLRLAVVAVVSAVVTAGLVISVGRALEPAAAVTDIVLISGQ